MSDVRAIAVAPLPPEPYEVVSRQDYRNAMARLAAAVNIITSVGPDGVCGFTASAVCSVTDTPPTLLVCVNRSTQSHPVIASRKILCVNTIASKHEALAFSFAGGLKEMSRRFEDASWSTAVTGSPLLDGAAASFDCTVTDVKSIGSHDVFYCEVVAVRYAEQGSSLIYLDRKFHAVQ